MKPISFLSAICCVMGLVLSGTAETIPTGKNADKVTPDNPSIVNILAYGVRTDGTADCTAGFQKALDDMAARNGGIVMVPTGRYRFDGSLTVPRNVAIKGTYLYSPSHFGDRGKDSQPPNSGSVFEVYGGRGDENAKPFITLLSSATVQGVVVVYPEQQRDAEKPIPYPYTFALRENNPALLDVELLNPYNGVDVSHSQRHLVRNVHGQPLHIGLYADAIYDIGRIENVHWNPWWSYSLEEGAFVWQRTNGVGFIFGRTDWHYVLNTFAFGYSVGYRFIRTENGAANGNFLGIGADYCRTAVEIEDTSHFGLLITNGEFVSATQMHLKETENPVILRVAPSFTGTARFVNCAFWGPTRRTAVIEGYGLVGLSDCTFVNWGHLVFEGEREPRDEAWAIEARSGAVMIRGCEFMEKRPQVWIGSEVDRAVISDNIVNGPVVIHNESSGNIIVRDNAGMPDSAAWKERYQHREDMRAGRGRAPWSPPKNISPPQKIR